MTSAASVPLGFITSILVARVLGPQGKGAYDLIFATSGLLALVLGLSLQSGVVYTVAKGKVSLGPLTVRLALIAVAEGVLATGLLLLLRSTRLSTAFLPVGLGPWAAVAIGASLTWSELGGYWRAMLIGRESIEKANVIGLLSRFALPVLLLAGLGIVLFQGHSTSPLVFVWISIGVTAATSLALLWAVRPWLHDFGATSGLSGVVSFALPCALANLAQFLNYRLDVFVVSYLLGSEQVGLYTLAVGVAQLVWLISNAVAVVLLPRVAASGGATRENAATTARATRLTLCVSLAMAGALGAARPLLPLVYGEAFQRSIAPFLWLLPGVLSFAVVGVIASYIAGIGKPQVNLAIALVGVSFTLALDLLLIPRLGIVGAAIASTISYSVSAVLSLSYFSRQSGMHVRQALLIEPADIQTAMRSLQAALSRRRIGCG